MTNKNKIRLFRVLPKTVETIKTATVTAAVIGVGKSTKIALTALL